MSLCCLCAVRAPCVRANERATSVRTNEQADDKSDGESEKLKPRRLQKIVDKRTRRGKVEYLIKWEGYPDTENTWEPKENLAGLDITAYEFRKEKMTGVRKMMEESKKEEKEKEEEERKKEEEKRKRTRKEKKKESKKSRGKKEK